MSNLKDFLSELKEKASKATHGFWEHDPYVGQVIGPNEERIVTCDGSEVDKQKVNGAHIAAVSPDVLLRLIAVLERAIEQRDAHARIFVEQLGDRPGLSRYPTLAEYNQKDDAELDRIARGEQ